MQRTKLLSRRILTLFMCLTILLSLSVAGSAFFWHSEDPVAPTLAPFAKNEAPGAVVTFSPEDFILSETSSMGFDGIVVTSLPDEAAGALRLSGRDLMRGEGVPAENLASLRFVPSTEEAVSVQFTCLPIYSDGTVGMEEVSITVNLAEEQAAPPIAENLSFETYKDVPVTGDLKATGGSGAVAFKIMQQPNMGEVTLDGARFRYTPAQGKTGDDSFTYVATDEKGNASAVATVTVKVNKRKDKDAVTYADMGDSPAHFAAIRLSEMGVITGESIGECSFFRPDDPVTRSEFVTMVVSACEIGVPAAALSTGLVDDDAIEIWAKPYVSAALNAGVVHGSLKPDGSKEFRPKDGVTKAEASVILNQAAELAEDGYEATFADKDEIPVWAYTAASNLSAARILSGEMMEPQVTLTRAEAAQMVYDTITLIHERDSSGGLLSWAFGK